MIESFIDRKKEEHDKVVHGFLENKENTRYYRELSTLVNDMIERLEKIVEENDSCPNLIFYIGYLKLSIGLPAEALENFTQAIDKFDDNTSENILWKGIAQCMCNMYDEGLDSFRFALQLDNNSYMSSLYKARCYMHMKDIERSLYCVKDYIDDSYIDNDRVSEVKYYVGCFFMSNGLISHAREYLEESLEASSTERTLRQLVKVYILEKNLYIAMDRLERLHREFRRDVYLFDIQVLAALRLCASSQQEEARVSLEVLSVSGRRGVIFGEIDVKYYTGVCSMMCGRYEDSIRLMMSAKKMKYGSEDTKKMDLDHYNSDIRVLDCMVEGGEEGEAHTFTSIEVDWNVSICMVMDGRLEEGVKKMYRVGEYEGVHNGVMHTVRSMLTTHKDTIEVDVFPHANRLCGIYEGVEKNGTKLRLSYDLPFVNIEGTDIKVDINILDDINISIIQHKPDAPWIKRGEKSSSIVYTDGIIQREAVEVYNIHDIYNHIDVDHTNNNIKLNIQNIYHTHHHHHLLLDTHTNHILNKILYKK